MDKSINDYLDLRLNQILLQLQSITNELISIVKLQQELSSDFEDALSDGSEDVQRITEAEIIEIMKTKKEPWSKRKLIDASRERNSRLRGVTHPTLGDQIISIILRNQRFRLVRPGYWVFVDEDDAVAKE